MEPDTLNDPGTLVPLPRPAVAGRHAVRCTRATWAGLLLVLAAALLGLATGCLELIGGITAPIATDDCRDECDCDRADRPCSREGSPEDVCFRRCLRSRGL